MIKVLAFGAALSLLATPAFAAAPQPADQAALEQLARQMDDAWGAADVNANAAVFSEKATARFGEEPLVEGRNAIREQLRSFFKDRPTGLRHVTKIERIDQISPDLATWDAEVRVERQQFTGTWATLTLIRSVMLVAREADGWRIRSVRAFPVPSTPS